MSRLQKSILVVLLLVLSACSREVSFSFEVLDPVSEASATPVIESAIPATFTPYAEKTQVTPVVETPIAPSTLPQTTEFAQTSMDKPTDFSPVLYGGKLYDTKFFLLLGGVSRDAWLAPDESVARFSGEVTYSLHSMTQEAKYFLWGKAPEFQQTCESYIVGTDAGLDEGGFVAVLDGWDVIKRDVADLSDEAYYQQLVARWLTSEGVNNPQPGIMQVFMVNLEGDQNDEIFISATHLDESQHTTQAGDYSVILMIKAEGDSAAIIPVVGDVYDSPEPEMTFPRTYSLANFIDLNQDGVLEVVVEIQGWEKFGAIVFQVNGLEIRQSLRAEC